MKNRLKKIMKRIDPSYVGDSKENYPSYTAADVRRLRDEAKTASSELKRVSKYDDTPQSAKIKLAKTAESADVEANRIKRILDNMKKD